MPPYLIDTSFFIQAHRIGFPMDVFPSFWNKIKALAGEEKIISIDKVKKEVYVNEDELKKWFEINIGGKFFRDSSTIISAYTKVVRWAVSKNNQYNQKALNEFLDADVADAWLVAYAHANNLIVVTNEVSAPMSKSSIKIPDVCIAFNVPYLNTIQLFRALNEKI